MAAASTARLVGAAVAAASTARPRGAGARGRWNMNQTEQPKRVAHDFAFPMGGFSISSPTSLRYMEARLGIPRQTSRTTLCVGK